MNQRRDAEVPVFVQVCRHLIVQCCVKLPAPAVEAKVDQFAFIIFVDGDRTEVAYPCVVGVKLHEGDFVVVAEHLFDPLPIVADQDELLVETDGTGDSQKDRFSAFEIVRPVALFVWEDHQDTILGFPFGRYSSHMSCSSIVTSMSAKISLIRSP